MEAANVPSSWIERFRPKERRINFLRQRTAAHIAMQIRGLRDARGWSQAELASRADLAQPAVSRCERVGYGKQTISTLLKLAEAFDVGLDVSFVSFGELWRRERKLASEPLVPQWFDAEMEGAKLLTTAKVVHIATRLPSVISTTTQPRQRLSRGTGQMYLFAEFAQSSSPEAEVTRARYA